MYFQFNLSTDYYDNLTLAGPCIGKPIPEVSMVYNDSILESKFFMGRIMMRNLVLADHC